MNHQWRGGRRAERSRPAVRKWMALAGVLVVGGLGWLYGSKIAELISVTAHVQSLQQEETALLRQRAQLRESLEVVDEPEVVEAEARRVLRWGYENEELLILVED